MNKKIIALIIAIIAIVAIVAGVSIWLVSSNNSNESNNANNNLNSNANMNENENNVEENSVSNIVENTVDNIVDNTAENTLDNATDNTVNSETSDNQKIAIIYFSATGTTEKVAEYIKDATGGDLIKIEPKEQYTDEDLSYNNNNSRATKEQNDSSARPEISNTIDTDSYDVIYLGYPIWFGDAPRIILTFLDNYDLSGKTVIPFCTSGSSGISTSVNYFKSNYKNVNWLDGERLTTSQSEVTDWVNSLNY